MAEHKDSTWASQADFGGTDGASFWVERRTAFIFPKIDSFSNRDFAVKIVQPRKSEDGQAIKRYLLSGDGLDSRPFLVKSSS